MKIDLIVGARPNLPKAAAILHAAKDFPYLQFRLVHTGQHKDIMSDPYFLDLHLPIPESLFVTQITNGTTGRLAGMIDSLASRFNSDRPDYAMVVGDCDSTAAGALAAAKSGIPVLHVEAGLRNGNMKMQEELNRRLVDSLSIKHYTTAWFAQWSLEIEGKKGILAGNTMVDTLFRFLPEAREKFSRKGPYVIFTLHRAENADDPIRLLSIIDGVREVAKSIPVIWTTHPRVSLPSGNSPSPNMTRVLPMSYLEFIAALEGAKFAITDSGGVQEETSALGVPCITVRDNTERRETLIGSGGTNVLVKPEGIVAQAEKFMKPQSFSTIPVYRTGNAAERILEDMCETL